jgi:hypothetical protein
MVDQLHQPLTCACSLAASACFLLPPRLSGSVAHFFVQRQDQPDFAGTSGRSEVSSGETTK